MTTVDPYTQPLPKTIVDKNGNITEEFRRWLVFDNRWKFDMWTRSGGSTDAIESIIIETGTSENLVSFLIGQVAFLKERVDALEKESAALMGFGDGFRAITVAQSYTATDYDYINAKQDSTIALPEYPAENSIIIIRNGDGSSIGLNGNGKTINGSLTGVLRRGTRSITFRYFIDSDEWVAE